MSAQTVAPPKALVLRARQVAAEGALAPGFEGTVASPCISVCRMTADRSHCEGCFRSIDEIRAWAKADTAQRQQIWAALLARAQMSAPGSAPAG